MFQAANVISFPGDPGTTNLLREYIGGPVERLDEVVARLCGLESAVFLIRQAEDHVPPLVATALLAIEAGLRDCIRVAELRAVA